MFEEINYLTKGTNQLTSEGIINRISFSGGSSILYNFFKTYLQKSSVEILEFFLKFTTGEKLIKKLKKINNQFFT